MFPNRGFDPFPQQPETLGKEGGMSSQTVPSSHTEATEQRTYTTVGSIYNPKATTPLQPPTRRARARRFPQPLRSPTGESFLPFPDALLSTLSLNDTAPASPPATTATHQQYSPLQQNYDRAVSPIPEPSKSVATTGIPMPSLRSGNLPLPGGIEGDDSSASEDTLASSRITVKGLTNLASYPNPMQKAAQKALARARNGNPGLSRPDTPSFPSMTPDLSKDRLANNSYGSAAAAAGPPKPLTAGPPGHRQFRPSTFEAASRILRPEEPIVYAPQTTRPFEFKPSTAPSYNGGNTSLSEFDHISANPGPSRPAPFTPGRDHGPVSRTLPSPTKSPLLTEALSAAVPTEVFYSTQQRKVHDTLPFERIKEYFPNSLPSNYDGRYTPIAGDWFEEYPVGKLMSSGENYSSEASRINRQFYSGIERILREQAQRERNDSCISPAKSVGVIGEERLRLHGSQTEKREAKTSDEAPHQPREATAAPAAENDDASALMDLAYATLLRYKAQRDPNTSAQNPWPAGFVPAEEAWVDSSEEAQNSFFDEPKEVKKKKASRRQRLGY